MGEDLTGENAQQTSASLRRLWEEDDEADVEDPDDPETYDRFENGDEVLLPKRNQLLASRRKDTGSGRRANNEHSSRISDMQDRTGE